MYHVSGRNDDRVELTVLSSSLEVFMRKRRPLNNSSDVERSMSRISERKVEQSCLS